MQSEARNLLNDSIGSYWKSWLSTVADICTQSVYSWVSKARERKGGWGGGGHPNQEIEDYTTKLLGDGAERANINIDLRQVYMLN